MSSPRGSGRGVGAVERVEQSLVRATRREAVDAAAVELREGHLTTFANDSQLIRALPGMLGKVRVPTLIVWGKEDRIVPVECAYLYQRAIAGAQDLDESFASVAFISARFRAYVSAFGAPG